MFNKNRRATVLATDQTDLANPNMIGTNDREVTLGLPDAAVQW